MSRCSDYLGALIVRDVLVAALTSSVSCTVGTATCSGACAAIAVFVIGFCEVPGWLVCLTGEFSREEFSLLLIVALPLLSFTIQILSSENILKRVIPLPLPPML